MKRVVFAFAAGFAALVAAEAQAVPVAVTGGQTSVLLDTELLETAAGLSLTGATGVVTGTLPGSVAFPINPRSGGSGLNTTFIYDNEDFPVAGSFSGTIEHSGSVTFNDAITVGNFTIGFNAGRAIGSATGFFVADTLPGNGLDILFDVGVPVDPLILAPELILGGELLVSPEFAAVLGQSGLTGADVGDALIETVSIISPGTLPLLAGGLLILFICLGRRTPRRHRRRRFG